MKCNHCGAQLQTGDAFCPECGKPVEAEPNPNAGQSSSDAAFCMNCGNPIPPGSSFCKICGTPVSAMQNDSGSASSYPADKKLRKNFFPGKRIIPAAAAVVVAGGIVFAGVGPGRQIVMQKLLSPKRYYQYIEMKNADKTSRQIAAFYQNLLHDNINLTSGGKSGEIEVELSEDMIDMIERASGEHDLEFLQHIALGTDFLVQDKKLELDVNGTLNHTQIGTVKAILDMKKDICYVQIPELNKDYLSAEVASGYGDLSDLNELFKTLSDVYEKTPDQEKVAKILKRYAEVAIKDVENVTRSKKKVNAGNLSNACTVLTVSMTDRELRKLCKDVIKAMRDDDELKEIIKETGSAIPNVSGSEAWDAFRDALSKVETAVDSIDEDVEFSMYVTNKGEIVGRSMEVDGVELSSVTLTKGKKYASDTSLSGKGTHVELEGNGTKSSGVINADFEVSYKGGSFEFSLDDFDQNSWENGILKGGISFEIGDIIRSLGISYWVPSEVNLFKSMRLGLMLDTTKGNNSMDITLYDDKDPMATLRAKETKTQLSSVDIPSKSYSSDDNTEWKDWIRDADYHEILDRLDKAGLPSSLLHQIEQWAQWSFNIN